MIGKENLQAVNCGYLSRALLRDLLFCSAATWTPPTKSAAQLWRERQLSDMLSARGLRTGVIKMTKYYYPRLTAADMPENDNKYYIRKVDGGYSPCIEGSPKHKSLTALSNCVGWAIGRVMEILQTTTNPLPYLNAEDFYNNTNLPKGQTPKNGAVACWRQGKLWNGEDGAGHVAVVEKVISDNEIITSESAYGGMAFYTKHRNNDNGKWGASDSYDFMGFIYPADDLCPIDCPFKIGDRVKIKNGATAYDGTPLANFVYDNTYIVREIDCGVSPDYIVVGTETSTTAAVRANDLYSADNFKVGDIVHVDGDDYNYIINNIVGGSCILSPVVPISKIKK